MLRSPLLPIFLTVFVDVLGLTIVLPLLPYYAEHFGASPFVVTLITASYAGCQLVSGPALGRISDRVGRKPTLLVSQMGTFVALIVLAFSNSLWMLFLGRIIDGCTAGNLSIAQAYISDVTTPDKRTKAFGLIGIAFGAGFLIGPAASGFLADRYGFAAPFFLAAALSLTSILTTTFLLPKVTPRADPLPEPVPGAPKAPTTPWGSFASFFSRPLPRRHLIEFACFTFAFATLVGGLALFLERRMGFGVAKTSLVFTFSGLIGGVIQGGVIGRLVKKLGEGRLAAAGFSSMAAGYAILAFTTNLPMLLTATAVSGFGIAVVRPCLTTLITKSVRRDEQGAALGVSQSITSLSSLTASPLAGMLITAKFLVAWALVASAASALGLVMRLRKGPDVVDAAAPVG